MSKTITLRLNETVYQKFQTLAKLDNRPISNYIETAALKFIEGSEIVDEFEMMEIKKNKELNQSLKQALTEVKERKGRFVKL